MLLSFSSTALRPIPLLTGALHRNITQNHQAPPNLPSVYTYTYVTKGDNNAHINVPLYPPDQAELSRAGIHGVVEISSPSLGILLLARRKVLGCIITFTLPTTPEGNCLSRFISRSLCTYQLDLLLLHTGENTRKNNIAQTHTYSEHRML